MPSKYLVKTYKENGTYHVYNRGIEKKDIFRDEKDYRYFLYLLKSYLTNPDDSRNTSHNIDSVIQKGRFKGKIDLLAYCLMPNHLHLLLRQKDVGDMSEFMRSIMTNYTMYFNKRRERIGKLYQGAFKAILVEDDDYLVHLSRYIHLNPRRKGCHPLAKKEYMSYEDYLGLRDTKWLNKNIILNYFESEESLNSHKYRGYKGFVEDLIFDEKDYLGKYSIDWD